MQENDSKSDIKVVKNIIMVAISNILTLVAGVLAGFVLPKIMTKPDYGYYKTFTLYFSYIGLFHFGLIDGIYLLYAGKKYDDLNKERFRLFTKVLFVFQAAIASILVIISLPFMFTNYGIIIFCLGINLLLANMTTYYQFLSQVTGRFKELSYVNIIKAILTSAAILALTLLFYLKCISLVAFTTYIFITTAISLIITLWYIYKYKDITFGKSDSFKENKAEVFNLFKVGIPLLIANLVSGFILTIDRQFVSILFDIETYASYAFAYNMLGLITTVISAISTVLYPIIKMYDEDRLKNNYNKLISIIAIFVALCVGAYYPIKFILENFLPNYLDSLPIFRVILPGLLISSCISMIMFNYYKSMNKQTRYFVISLIVLIISALANIIAYAIFKTPLSISIASVIIMCIWYFIVEFLIVKKYKINSFKNILYIVSVVSIYFVITDIIENPFLGFGVYLAAYILVTIVFYFRLIKNKFKIN